MSAEIVLIIASGLAIGTGSVVVLWRTLQSNRKEQRVIGLPFLIVLWTGFACSGFACAWLPVAFYHLDGPTPEIGADRATKLIQALEDYRADHDSYPMSLEALTPEYIRVIPAPGWRYRYYYGTLPSQSVRLQFKLRFAIGGSADDWYCYDSTNGLWKRYDSYC